MNEENKVTNKQEIGQIVEEPNVTFRIDGKIISSIFGFLMGINSEVPMKFEKDRIFMHLKSADNIQYAQVEISTSDILDYNPRLEYGSTEKNIIVNTRNVRLEKIDEINDITQPDNILTEDDMLLRNTGDKLRGRSVEVKVFEKIIEFHLPGSVIIWTDLIDNKERIENIMKTIDKLPDLIKKVRNDPAIKKSSVTIQPMWLERICNIKDVEQYESIFRLNISKKEGFNIISRSKDGFYELKLKPRYIHVDPNGDEETSICMDKEFMVPITKLVWHTPILIEVRTHKPIIFEKKLSEDVIAMLTVAPRLPIELAEEEKDTRDIETLVLAHSLNNTKKTQEKKVPELMDF